VEALRELLLRAGFHAVHVAASPLSAPHPGGLAGPSVQDHPAYSRVQAIATRA
jgi:hypothetical protein